MADPNETKDEREPNAENVAPPETPPIERSTISPIRRVRAGVPRQRRPLEVNRAAAPVAQVVAQAVTQPPQVDAAEETPAAQRELTHERARRVIAESELAAVKRDLAHSQTDLAALRESFARDRKTGRIGLVAVLMIGAFLIYRSVNLETPPRPAASLASKVPPTARLRQDSPQAEFAHGLDRLNYTLELAARDGPDETPEYAMRAVHAANPALCPFLWKDGQVSLIFGGGPLTLVSLGDMFSRCADAVAKLP